jgi:hypothetical protein
MNRFVDKRWVAGVAGIILSTIFSATTAALVPDPIVTAVRRNDCPKAVRELNSQMESKSGQTALFVAGRMLDEGICMKKDPAAATAYFARSTEMGDPQAALEYAAKIGMGEGTPQDYLRAGDICHTAGIDPRGRLSFYSLGYACTVRGVAGRMLRETLPKGAFRIPTAPAIVEFNPGSSQLRLLSAPRAQRAEAPTGSYVGDPLVNTQQVIEKAWRDAVAAVPRPDAANLGSEVVDLSLDIDTTLEAGLIAARDAHDPDRMLPGDIRLNLPGHGGHY